MRKVLQSIDRVQREITYAAKTTDAYVQPVRESLFKRFPVIALLLVTFGVSATFFGVERMLSDIAFLDKHPILIFLLGILLLTVSGRLYKKLG
jgi:hypothetical protein